MACCREALGLLFSDLDDAGFGAKRVLPERQQWIEAVWVGLKVFAELGINQVFQQGRHAETTAPRPAAGHRVSGTHGLGPEACGAVAASPHRFAPGQCTGGHQGEAVGEIFQTAPVVFPVQQGDPAGPMRVALALAQLHLGDPAAPCNEAEGPALEVAPPAQFIGEIGMAAGEWKPGEPVCGGGGIHGQSLHLPWPPLGFLGNRFSRLHGQTGPGGILAGCLVGGFAAAFARLHRAAWQGQASCRINAGAGQQIPFAKPGLEILAGEGEGMQGGCHPRTCGLRDTPGIRPDQQGRLT